MMQTMNPSHVYFFFGFLLVLLIVVLWVITIRDILLNGQRKMLILLTLLAPVIGPLIYFHARQHK